MSSKQLTLTAQSEAELREVVARFGLFVHEHTLPRLHKGRVSVEAFGEEDQIAALQSASRSSRGVFGVSKPVDVSAQMARLLKKPARLPRFIADNLNEAKGDKPAWYSTYDEIERELRNNAGQGSAEWSRVFHLDRPSHSKAAIKPIAIHMGTPIDSKKPTALILGGVHGNELIPPDVLCRLPGDIWRSIQIGSDLRYGKLTIRAADLRTMMKKINVIIVPCVNPDGRAAALANLVSPKPDLFAGRKNARQVDINRNFDFLWDAKSYFHPSVFKTDSVIGFTPDKNTYRGTDAASENETRNIVDLLDKHPSIRCLLDLHAGAGPSVLYNWGIDQNGTEKSNRFNKVKGKRIVGVRDDTYFEYVPEKPDGEDLLGLAETMAHFGNSPKTAQSTNSWSAAQSFAGLYPTCASTDDYAYSRHVTSPQRAKVYGFTAEVGSFSSTSWENVTARWTEVAAAVVGFLLKMSTVRFSAPVRATRKNAAPTRAARKPKSAKKKASVKQKPRVSKKSSAKRPRAGT